MSNFVFTICIIIIVMEKYDTKIRVGRNIRFLRESKKLSIESLSDDLGISPSGLYSYESGRTEPGGKMLVQLSSYFHVSTDALLRSDLTKTEPGKMMNLGTNRILFPMMLDDMGRDLIELVPVKAIAGYTSGYSDPEYITNLPVFQLPFLAKNRKYRAFQLSGDSMLPIPSSSYVIGEYVENLRELRDGQMYVLLLGDEGIVFKVVFRGKKKLLLRSLNTDYAPYEIDAGQVREAWKFVNYISSELPRDTSDTIFMKLVELEKQVALIREKVE